MPSDPVKIMIAPKLMHCVSNLHRVRKLMIGLVNLNADRRTTSRLFPDHERLISQPNQMAIYLIVVLILKITKFVD